MPMLRVALHEADVPYTRNPNRGIQLYMKCGYFTPRVNEIAYLAHIVASSLRS